MSDEEVLAELDPMPDSSEFFSELMDDASDKMKWARTCANQLMEFAQGLENRANLMRGLASSMVLEAQALADETMDLLTMEFPTGEEDE